MLLDLHQAAEYLNVSYDWLQRQTAARKLPHTRLGKHVRFTSKNLDDIIAIGTMTVREPVQRSSARSRL